MGFGGTSIAGLAVLAWLAWRERCWSAAGRVHFTPVAAAALGFFWLLLDWGLVSF